MENEANVKFMRACEVSRVLGVSVFTLRKWRQSGKGPAYISIGSRGIRYLSHDVDAYRKDR